MKAPDSVKDIANIFTSKIKKKIGHLTRFEEVNDGHFDKTITFVFIPIVSRTGTDIDATVRDIKGKKWFT